MDDLARVELLAWMDVPRAMRVRPRGCGKLVRGNRGDPAERAGRGEQFLSIDGLADNQRHRGKQPVRRSARRTSCGGSCPQGSTPPTHALRCNGCTWLRTTGAVEYVKPLHSSASLPYWIKEEEKKCKQARLLLRNFRPEKKSYETPCGEHREWCNLTGVSMTTP